MEATPLGGPVGEVSLSPGALLRLQRSIGNAAVERLILMRQQRLISTGQATANMADVWAQHPANPRSRADVRFRVPTATDVQAMLAAGDVPEDKLKAAMATVLTRMAGEKKLKSSDPVADIIKRLFPSAGKFDEDELKKVLDVADRNLIYVAVADARTKVSAGDRPKLLAAMDDSLKLIDQARADKTGLTQVFGSKATLAAGVYLMAKQSLEKVKNDLDKAVDTDYNLDDAQVGLGGFASYAGRHIHLDRATAEVKDEGEAKITIIHECSHLANAVVDDRGYYGTDGFEGMSENDKVGNAAHFEELPRRILGISSYAGKTFKPGKKTSGSAETFEDKVRRLASEYLRKAWDKAVDVHMFFRDIRKDIEGGDKKSFTANQVRILELSKLEHLTIHEQTPSPATINMIDIVLAEGVARATTKMQDSALKLPVPSKAALGKTEKTHADDLIGQAIKSYGALTGNDADDKKLMDWLVAEYRKGF
jgi:hypothetical protein